MWVVRYKTLGQLRETDFSSELEAVTFCRNIYRHGAVSELMRPVLQ